MEPRINASVYVTEQEEIDVRVCGVPINPIAVRIGSRFATNALGVYLSVEQADKLATQLRQAIQDHAADTTDSGVPLSELSGLKPLHATDIQKLADVIDGK